MLHPFHHRLKPAILLTATVVITLLMIALAPAAYAYEDEELAFLTIINSYRQSNGLGPLSLSNSLSAAAEGHSYDMATRNFFSHTGSNGSTPWDRMRAAGYTYNTYLGENIAAGYMTAATVFEGWRNSPSHNAGMLNGNYHAIGIGRVYDGGSQYGWYWTTDFGGVAEDSSPPQVSIAIPSGSQLVSGSVPFQANVSDDVGITKVDLYIDNSLVASDTNAPYSYTWNTASYINGTSHTLKAIAYDTSGKSSQVSTTVIVDNFSVSKRYFFTWYDQSSGDWVDWVLMGNTSGVSSARTSVKVGSLTYADRNMTVGAPAETPTFPGVMDGPVTVSANQPVIASQRVNYKNSFNEITAMPESELETRYHFTWYDANASWGMEGDWILIGNQGTSTANVEVFIGGTLMGTYSVPVGGRVTPIYPNVTNGPVEVISTNNQPLIVSQRVHYRGSFSEVWGLPHSKLSSNYYFTWYDGKPENGMQGDWILIGNKDSSDASVEVYIGGVLRGSYVVPPGQRITPMYPGLMGGPVEVKSTNGKKLIVSQRVHYKSSFEEVQGMTADKAGTDLWFTWYDSKIAHGMRGDWVILTNPGNTTANVSVYLGGNLQQQTTVSPHSNSVLAYPETMGGPIHVVSTNGQPIYASQRVHYLDSFNEVIALQL